MNAFAFMPLAAIVDGVVFCVHGGIGPGLEYIHQIQEIPRPIHDQAGIPSVHSLVWADPTGEEDRFRKSVRPQGEEFGAVALEEFMAANGFRLIVRGHQVVSGATNFTGCL
jgi:diadenosine tetraphosphatase ApaH/serine/threonine PP2A family protein phosphatase